VTAPRRLHLRLALDLPAPTLQAMRTKLGGRVEAGDEAGAGRLVHVPGREAPGVLLFEDARAAHVWVGDGLVKKLAKGEVSAHEGTTPDATLRLAEAGRAFAELSEGDDVIFDGPDGASARAVLLEKCRLGALVGTEANKVVAVGFSRLRRVPRD
jgi:hypothetical protein